MRHRASNANGKAQIRYLENESLKELSQPLASNTVHVE